MSTVFLLPPDAQARITMLVDGSNLPANDTQAGEKNSGANSSVSDHSNDESPQAQTLSHDNSARAVNDE